MILHLYSLTYVIYLYAINGHVRFNSCLLKEVSLKMYTIFHNTPPCIFEHIHF
jgi:hypothetical protein